MCHAAVQNFAGLMACRTLLGVFEASMNPASMIIFAMYYTRQEQPFRMGLWIGSAGIGYIIAGIATFGIGHINSGIESWRVLFLFWGAFTMAWGVVLLVWLPGSPATSKCWTEEQRIGILDRIKDNGTGIEDKRFKFDQFKEAMLDPKTWLLFLFATASNSPNGGLTAVSCSTLHPQSPGIHLTPV
jgi:MFS family permease